MVITFLINFNCTFQTMINLESYGMHQSLSNIMFEKHYKRYTLTKTIITPDKTKYIFNPMVKSLK